jgi:hypothetical protein
MMLKVGCFNGDVLLTVINGVRRQIRWVKVTPLGQWRMWARTSFLCTQVVGA